MTHVYTVALAKGQGMVSETVQLLKTWEEGLSPVDLRDRIISGGLLPKATNYRAADIVTRVFAPRYLTGTDGPWPASRLKRLVESGVSADRLLQLFLVFTSRANRILHDFIVSVFWPHYRAGARVLEKQDVIEFLKAAEANGRLPKKWSEEVRLRASRHLLSTLTDFKLTRDLPQGRREILPYGIQPATTLYLAHEVHFSGAGDNAVLDLADWQLFGLDRQGVLEELRKVAAEGHFIVQFAGDLLRIAWKYKSMEECLDVLAQR